MRWFDNDGGPLIIIPRASLSSWEGGDVPSRGRVVTAEFRATPGGAATDYDRACDVPEIAVLHIGDGWGVVLGSERMANAGVMESPARGVHVVVGVEYADDGPLARLEEIYRRVAPSAWRSVGRQLLVGPGGILLFHAASRGDRLSERPQGRDGRAIIGDAIAIPTEPGLYSVEYVDVDVPEEAALAMCRFRRASGP